MPSIDGAVARLICPHVRTRFGAWSNAGLEAQHGKATADAVLDTLLKNGMNAADVVAVARDPAAWARDGIGRVKNGYPVPQDAAAALALRAAELCDDSTYYQHFGRAARNKGNDGATSGAEVSSA